MPSPSSHTINQSFSSLTIVLHILTLLLIYSYIKQQLTFNFLYTLTPSLIVFLAQIYQIIHKTKGVLRAKYLISFMLLGVFFVLLTHVVKNQGGIQEDEDDKNKFLVRHRKCFELLIMAMGVYVFYDVINHQKIQTKSVVKDVLLNILSSLSTPMTICSGGACNSIYISTITSILSSFSMPLTLVVPLLNVVGHLLQLVGLVSLYSTNKWKSYAFWIYLVSMVGQYVYGSGWVGWGCCAGMVLATVINARMNKVVYGRKKEIFKESIV